MTSLSDYLQVSSDRLRMLIDNPQGRTDQPTGVPNCWAKLLGVQIVSTTGSSYEIEACIHVEP